MFVQKHAKSTNLYTHAAFIIFKFHFLFDVKNWILRWVVNFVTIKSVMYVRQPLQWKQMSRCWYRWFLEWLWSKIESVTGIFTVLVMNRKTGLSDPLHSVISRFYKKCVFINFDQFWTNGGKNLIFFYLTFWCNARW